MGGGGTLSRSVGLIPRGGLFCGGQRAAAAAQPGPPLQDVATGPAGPAGHGGHLPPRGVPPGEGVHLCRPVGGRAAGRQDLLAGSPGAGAVPDPGGSPGQEHPVPGGAAAPQEGAGPALPGRGGSSPPAPGPGRRLLRRGSPAQRHRAGRGALAPSHLLPAPPLARRPPRPLLLPPHHPGRVRGAAAGAGGGHRAPLPAAAGGHGLLVPQLLPALPDLLGRGSPRGGPRRAPLLAGPAALGGGLLPPPGGLGGAGGPPGPRPGALGGPAAVVQRALLLQPPGAGPELREGDAGGGPSGGAARRGSLLQLRAPGQVLQRDPHPRARGQGVRAPGPAVPAAGQPPGVRGLEPGLPAALLRRPPALRPALQRGAGGLRGERPGGHRLLRRPHAGGHADQVHGRRLGHGLRLLRAGPRHRLPGGGHLPGRPPPLRHRRAREVLQGPLRLRAAHGRPPAPPLRQRLPGGLPLLRGAGGARAGPEDHLHRLQLRLHLGLPLLPQRRPGGQGPRHRLHPRHLLHPPGPALRQPRPQPPPGQPPHTPGPLQGGPGRRRHQQQLRDAGGAPGEHLQSLEPRGPGGPAPLAAPAPAPRGRGRLPLRVPAAAVPAALQPPAPQPLGPPPWLPPAAPLPRRARPAPRLAGGEGRLLGKVPPGRDAAARGGGHQQQHLRPEQPLGPPGGLRGLPPRQRDPGGAGPGGLGDRGLPARAPRRGRPQHGHPRQLGGLLPAPLQLLRRGPFGGRPGPRHRPPPGPPDLLPPAGAALDPGHPRALRGHRALRLQRHLLGGVTGHGGLVGAGGKWPR